MKMSDLDFIEEEESFHPSLQTMPVEIFLYICTFLEGKDIIENLKNVCRNFDEILSDDTVWRTWLKHRWPELPTSSICYKDDAVPSQPVCLDIDRGLQLWSKLLHYQSVEGSAHISTVDTVKLIENGRIGISGSRDRSLAVWSVSDKLELLQHKNNAHEGWIWALASCQETKRLYSCSWDSSIKEWSLDGQLTPASTFKCKAAALSVVCRPDLVAAGLFTARVEMFDPRSGPVGAYSSHSRSILALCLVRNFIVSASEDRTISVWDITAGKPFKSAIQVSKDAHPMTLSFNTGDLLMVGDTESRLHVLDTSNDSFTLQESFNLGHKPRGTITSMWNNLGFIMTGSKDATVRIHATTRPPHLIKVLTSSHGGVTAVDYSDPVLFVGCVNNAVEMWMPS